MTDGAFFHPPEVVAVRKQWYKLRDDVSREEFITYRTNLVKENRQVCGILITLPSLDTDGFASMRRSSFAGLQNAKHTKSVKPKN